VKNALAYDIESLRDAMKNFGLNNPEFSRELYSICYDVNDILQHSLEQLNESLWYDEWVDIEWLFDELRTNRSILDLIGIKGQTCMAKTVCKKLQNLHQHGDKKFLKNFVVEYLSQDQRKKLACKYWLKGVGSMGEFAGNAEMVLFSRLFGLNLLIVKNTVDGPEIQSSRMYLHEKSFYELSKITCQNDLRGNLVPPATIKTSIFVWIIDPKDPGTAYKGGHVCSHYVTLNLLKPTDELVCPDMFTFARKPPPPPPKKEELEEESLGEESSEKEISEKESSEMEPSKKETEPTQKEDESLEKYPSEKESEKKKEPLQKTCWKRIS
jgi:hypothetical protein